MKYSFLNFRQVDEKCSNNTYNYKNNLRLLLLNNHRSIITYKNNEILKITNKIYAFKIGSLHVTSLINVLLT